jgi:DNA-nicking Smr family endonuclease
MGRLRRGQMRPEARLDLHGMTRKEAYAALTAFIPRAQADGRRCVVVITGKGRVSEGGGVLRNEVPGWLNAPAIRQSILGFAAAQPRDGGTGALYVLLRRARSATLTPRRAPKECTC